MKQLTRSGLFILACLTCAGCSSTKSLKPGQYLYTGADIEINPDSSARIDNHKDVKEALEGKTRPRPNKSLLGIKFKLGLYNLAGQPKKAKGGLRNWLRRNGEPPVLLSEVRIPYNNAVLNSYLISQGYLQSEVTGDTILKGKKGKAVYTARTGPRYKINSMAFAKDSLAIVDIINTKKDRSLIKVGEYYDLDVFKNERIRIDNDLKEEGYFYFNPDYLILQADSTIGKNLVDIRLKVKDIAPDAALKPYTINNINIYPNYSLRRDSVLRRSTPEIHHDFNIYDTRRTFKPSLFDRLVFFKKGVYYNRADHNKSLNRMVNIGVFRAVKAEFLPVDSFRNNQLNLNVYLTPLRKNSLTFSVTGTSKSNNFVGSELKLTQTTRNLFRGAEQLDVSASGGFETQVSGVSKGLNSYSFTTEAKLSFPRFLTPFKGINSTNDFIPKTIASISYQLLSRGSLYNLNSFKTEFGYNWRENQYKEHTFNPISVNYVTSKVTDTLGEAHLYAQNPGLQKNLENQFIIGSNYNFTYSDQINQSQRNNIYLNGGLETGGNVWGMFASKNDEGRKSILGIPINQFIRLEADIRDYFKITKKVTWASRLNLGYGYAYGNSSSIPFVRQFFAGGTNDIRAFAARSLGPGTFYYKDYLQPGQDVTYTDQSGDIKAMLNTELRFKLVSILHGALFADAGNVWLRKEDVGTPAVGDTPAIRGRPGSGFKLRNALNEIAVGTGAGLRLDATIFVIRLDIAFPIRKPYLPEGQRWVLDQVDFGDKTWRRENLVYNIGIGYPF